MIAEALRLKNPWYSLAIKIRLGGPVDASPWPIRIIDDFVHTRFRRIRGAQHPHRESSNLDDYRDFPLIQPILPASSGHSSKLCANAPLHSFHYMSTVGDSYWLWLSPMLFPGLDADPRIWHGWAWEPLQSFGDRNADLWYVQRSRRGKFLGDLVRFQKIEKI
jgi:hypothetical protein